VSWLSKVWGKDTDLIVGVMPHQTMGFWRSLWQALQHLLTAAGANILGPILMHLDPGMALFTSGIGTLIYNRFVGVPAYMGTSFSYIAVIAYVMTSPWGSQNMVAGGIIVAGLTTMLVGVIVKLVGYRWVNVLIRPAVWAMVVIAIGLILGPTAFGSAIQQPTLAIVTFVLGVIFATMFKKDSLFSALPILLAMIASYAVALFMGQVNLAPVEAAPWFTLPRFVVPVFDVRVCLPMALVTLTAVIMEHIGHLKGMSSIVGTENYDERMARSLFFDGVSNALSWAGTPSVTYGENMGVFAITRVFSLKVMYLAGGIAVLAGFLGKLSPLISSIPSGVLGGATFLLFGMIAWAGFRLFTVEGEGRIDLSDRKNQVIVAAMGTMMVVGTTVDYLRTALAGITPEDLASSPASVATAVKSLQFLCHSLRIGNSEIPALVAVALLGIAMNVVLNFREILGEFRKKPVAEAVTSEAVAGK